MNLNNIFSTQVTILKKTKSGKILKKIVTKNQLTYTFVGLNYTDSASMDTSLTVYTEDVFKFPS